MEVKLTLKLNYVLLPAGFLVGLVTAIGFNSMAEETELDSGDRVIPYNGVLEFNGTPLNGQADLRFTITDLPGDPEGANCYYQEEHDNITAYGGRFSANIGSVDATNAPLDPCVFDSDAIYIEIGVRDADSNGEFVALNGAQQIHPVPFSYWSAEGSDFKVDGGLVVSGNITNPSGDVTVNDALDVTGNIQNPSGELDINDDTKINRLRLTFHSNDTPMLLFDNTSFDSNGDLSTMGDYKLVLREESTPAASYGFGIQSSTLFANANGNIDLKIGGEDVLNVTTGGMNLTGQANISGAATVGANLSVTGSTSVTGNTTVGGNLTVTGNISGFMEEATYERGTNTVTRAPDVLVLASKNDHVCFVTQADTFTCSITDGAFSGGVEFWVLASNSNPNTSGSCRAICLTK